MRLSGIESNDLVSDLGVSLISGSNRDLFNDRLHESSGNECRVRLPDDVLGSIKIVARATDEQETLLPVPNDGLQHLLVNTPEIKF